jgi:hypothetical protein
LRNSNKSGGELQQQVDSSQRGPKPEEKTVDRQQIEQQTSELRGLSFKNPVSYKIIERAELRQVLARKVKEQYTEQQLRDYSRSLAAFGLIPDGTDLLKVLVSLYGEQVAAFYVPEERSLYTFKDLVFSSNLDKMLLSHELTHALQDQNFDLQKFPLKIKDNDDLALATSALVEGDATVLMTRWYVENIDPSKMLGDLGAMFGQDTTKLREAPAFLRELLCSRISRGSSLPCRCMCPAGRRPSTRRFAIRRNARRTFFIPKHSCNTAPRPSAWSRRHWIRKTGG